MHVPNRLRPAILVIWIIGFLIGTTSHITDLVRGGLGTYAQFPTGLRIYWGCLTLLDPLAIVLLVLRRRAAIVLSLVIILSDISVNWSVYLTISGNPLYGMINQTVFAAILVATAPLLWHWFHSHQAGNP